MDSNDVQQDDSIELPTAQVVGSALREAREAQGLSEQAVASELRLTVTSVRHIEAGDWERLGAPVYLRGYLRSYGRLVDVDVTEGLGSLASDAVPVEAPLEALTSSGASRRGTFDRSLRIASYCLATALVAVPVVFVVIQAFEGSLFGGSEEGEPVTMAAPVPAEATGDETASVETSLPMIASMTGLTARRERAVETPAPVEVPPVFDNDFEEAAADAATAEPEASTTDVDPEPLESAFELILTDAVWVDIRDGAGERLAYGTKAAGSTLRLPLSEGLRVRLGNADAVVVRVGGQDFDLAPHRRRDVVEFTLPPSRPTEEG